MFVYKISNKLNGKCYIGQTSQKTIHRLQEHKSTLRSNTHRNPHLQKAWNKYGEEAFEFIIIQNCNSVEELNGVEDKLIKELNTIHRDFGYNIRSGGDNSPMAEETKLKISQAKKGISIHTAESKAKIVKFLTGRIHSDESKRKRSEKLKGYIWSETQKDIWAKSQRPQGYPTIVSPEGIEYSEIVNMTTFCREHGLSWRTMGNIVNGKGVSHKGWHVKGREPSELKHAINLSLAARPHGYPIVLDKNNNTYSIQSLSKFCREHKLALTCMSNLINKKRESYNGWTILEKTN